MLTDLFDALGIDLDDVTLTRGSVTDRWELMRSDDNCNAALVATFSGYVRAAERASRLEAQHHKQTYWLRQRG